MPRNLVLARVGPGSLHPAWVAGGASRTWDLRLVPYVPVVEEARTGCHVGDVVPGPKWAGLREALATWDGWRAYDYIWMPDDDLLATPQAIDRLFATAAGLSLDLFAPALDHDSYFAHFDTVRNPRFFGRWVGFVEIMAPGFSRAALERLLPTLDESETGWGWGLDSVWPKLLGYRNVAVLDGVTVTHTRPVGAMRDPELRDRVLAESDALLARYDCRQEHVTYGGFGADLEPIELDGEALLHELAAGWRPLIDADPRVLSWLGHYQRGDAVTVPPYPVAGTPRAPLARAA